MMVKRKLDGEVNESSLDQEICKSDATVHNFWWPAPSGTGSHSWQAGSPAVWARLEILKACC